MITRKNCILFLRDLSDLLIVKNSNILAPLSLGLSRPGNPGPGTVDEYDVLCNWTRGDSKFLNVVFLSVRVTFHSWHGLFQQTIFNDTSFQSDLHQPRSF